METYKVIGKVVDTDGKTVIQFIIRGNRTGVIQRIVPQELLALSNACALSNVRCYVNKWGCLTLKGANGGKLGNIPSYGINGTSYGRRNKRGYRYNPY